jgi:hypothetical protein
LAGETIDTMFSWFQSIVKKMHANKAQLPYMMIMRERSYQRVWEVKVSAIIKLPNYETLTVDELFSNLKSTEIYH